MTIKLTVQEMACGGCVASIKEALSALDANVEVNADLESGAVEVTTNVSAEDIRLAIEEAGFPAQFA